MQVTVQLRSGAQMKQRKLLFLYMAFYIYILYSPSSNQYYVGSTEHVDARLERHNRGMVPSTKAYGPWELKHTELFPSREEAVIREKEIKSKKSRVYIEKLIRGTGGGIV